MDWCGRRGTTHLLVIGAEADIVHESKAEGSALPPADFPREEGLRVGEGGEGGEKLEKWVCRFCDWVCWGLWPPTNLPPAVSPLLLPHPFSPFSPLLSLHSLSHPSPHVQMSFK